MEVRVPVLSEILLAASKTDEGVVQLESAVTFQGLQLCQRQLRSISLALITKMYPTHYIDICEN